MSFNLRFSTFTMILLIKLIAFYQKKKNIYENIDKEKRNLSKIFDNLMSLNFNFLLSRYVQHNF